MTTYTLEFASKTVSSHWWKRWWQSFFKMCLYLTEMYSWFPIATHLNATALIYTCSLFTAVSSFNLNHLIKLFMVLCVMCLLSTSRYSVLINRQLHLLKVAQCLSSTPLGYYISTLVKSNWSGQEWLLQVCGWLNASSAHCVQSFLILIFIFMSR